MNMKVPRRIALTLALALTPAADVLAAGVIRGASSLGKPGINAVLPLGSLTLNSNQQALPLTIPSLSGTLGSLIPNPSITLAEPVAPINAAPRLTPMTAAPQVISRRQETSRAASPIREGAATLSFGDNKKPGAAVTAANVVSAAGYSANQSGISSARAYFSAGSIFDNGADRRQTTAAVDLRRQQKAAFRSVDNDRAAYLADLANEIAEGRASADVVKGAAQLKKYIAISNVTPAQLATAWDALAFMSDAKVAQMRRLARRHLETETENSTPGAIGPNLEHIDKQHLAPAARDIDSLFPIFSKAGQTKEQFAERFFLLQEVHDLGKVEMPEKMKAALSRAFPKGPMWYVNMFILPHDYGSMHWIDAYGQESGLSKAEIIGLQRLMANHDFGIDLSKEENAEHLDHWWPSAFRTEMIPALAALGIPVERLFPRGSDGNLQYGDTESSPLAGLLTAYDRALPSEFTNWGLVSLYKFSNQDYNGWKAAAAAAEEKGTLAPPTTFRGSDIAENMRATALWTLSEIDGVWKAIYKNSREKLAAEGYNSWEAFQEYPPYKAQRVGAGRLLNIVERFAAANTDTRPGEARYKTQAGKTITVSMDSVEDPVKTLFDLMIEDNQTT
ncbi:MAG: hypothetical protein COB53_03775 [Elusimicrobia bacterium]|nr:MAG: hypothetical protein COB53_03775 [Elusimicrobiota bacterium]